MGREKPAENESPNGMGWRLPTLENPLGTTMRTCPLVIHHFVCGNRLALSISYEDNRCCACHTIWHMNSDNILLSSFLLCPPPPRPFVQMAKAKAQLAATWSGSELVCAAVQQGKTLNYVVMTMRL